MNQEMEESGGDRPNERGRPAVDSLQARVRELEGLCNDVLIAGVDVGLPRELLERLWSAVGHGDLPQAFSVDFPRPPAPQVAPPPALPEPARAVEPSASAAPRPGASQSLPPLPNVPLTANPLTARADTRPLPPQDDLLSLAEKKTVAVVDDDPVMLDVLSRILQRENFELLMASGGAEAIQKIDARGGVDLLVTDFAMPGMQGRELAERVRQRYPGVKVLYQTGFSDMLFEDTSELEEGAAFLEKPFTARGLREAARLVLFGTLNPH